MTYEYDYLVIGGGIAGMSFALKVAKTSRVALICKTTLDEANTALAQGGVASVTNLAVDNFDKHFEDTMIAGDYLSDPEAVRKVVQEAPGQIRELIGWGVDFDRRDDGEFDLHREGGHSEFRILTTPTTPATRYSRASYAASARIPTSTYSSIISQ